MFSATLCCSLSLVVPAQAHPLDKALAELPSPALQRAALGVTRKQTAIPYLYTVDDLNVQSPRRRVLLIGGLDGSDESVQATLAALRWFHTDPAAKPWRERVALSAVPCANPDGWAAGKGPGNGAGGNPLTGYPPQGDYRSPTDPEAAYLWRFVGQFAPDLVVVVLPGKELAWNVPAVEDTLFDKLKEALPARATPRSGLTAALTQSQPGGVGRVPALEALTPDGRFLRPLLEQLDRTGFPAPSGAGREMRRRLGQTPRDVAWTLSQVYGRELKTVAYIPTVALVGRLRLGELRKNPGELQAVVDIVKPYVEGRKLSLEQGTSGVNLAGHLVFAELARLTKDPNYVRQVQAAADRALDADGKPRSIVPGHSEMSDAVFMACPILAAAGKLTGEKKYFEACANHLASMRKLCIRGDGLYRHSPLDEAAWGRGNGFPALGLALSLSDMPADFPRRDELLRAFREHIAALLKHQDATGAWHQVIDVPGSYRELTATCMITFALARGVKDGWLERKTCEPAIRRAWDAIRARVDSQGGLVDVCEGTGKQKDLRAYLDRKAILGRDDRGGAMALLVAVELATFLD